MTIIGRSAIAGKCVDASTPITESAAKTLISRGISIIIRTLAYKPLASKATDLSAAELTMLTDAGMSVMLYQRVRSPGWIPSQSNGFLDARAAHDEAQGIGYPEGCTIWCDAEGEKGTSQDAETYLHDWANGIEPYSPALYCGYSDLLTPQQRYMLPDFHLYGSDAGHRQVAMVGVSWQQGSQVVIEGITYDLGTIAPDLIGRLPTVCAAG